MKLLLKNALIFDSQSSFHNKKRDILIENGVITDIGNNLSAKNSKDLKGQIVTPGLIDLFAHFNEPGFEHKETLASGIEAAAFSGFTDICVVPNTDPVIESKSDVIFLKSKSSQGVSIHPIAAVSEGTRGENLTEILDLNSAGAIAFSDGLQPIWNSELLLKALQYVQKFDGLIINRAKDLHLSQHSHMHEGVVSTSMGIKGEPALSEELSLKRDIEILRYAGGRMHFTHLSTAKSVELIKEAKKSGLQVTCDVAIHQLLYTDQYLLPFDSSLKVDPPFRTEKDRKALINGVKSGVIDAIVSSHQPQDIENKELEFDLAAFGMCSLPTLFSNLIKLEPQLPLEVSIERLTKGPRAILRMDEIKIEKGSVARLAIFDRSKEWIFNSTINPSFSNNSPLLGETMKGKCSGILNKESVKFQEEIAGHV